MARIPTIGEHKGVPLFAGQSEARLQIVRRDIDRVCGMSDIRALVAVCRDRSWVPESRLWAFARLKSLCEQAQDERRVQPGINLVDIEAHVCVFESLAWSTALGLWPPPQDNE